MSKRIAFLGLGVMGAPMAGHLARAGHRVTVYNRTAGKARGLGRRRMAARVARRTPAEAARGADAVLTCVGNDADLPRWCVGRDGALRRDARRARCSSITPPSPPAIARRIAEAGEQRGMLCARRAGFGRPGRRGERHSSSIMCGGTRRGDDGGRSRSCEAYAARIVHVGEAGSGQLTKMVNQICIAGVLAGPRPKRSRFAQAAGLDPDKVFEAISGGAAQSWQMDNRWQTMDAGEFDFGFAVDWMRKDLGHRARRGARATAPSLPLTALVDQFYAEVQAHGRRPAGHHVADPKADRR